jgi:hypothetical protein
MSASDIDLTFGYTLDVWRIFFSDVLLEVPHLNSPKKPLGVFLFLSPLMPG